MYKCQANSICSAESLLSLHYSRIHEGNESVPKKRPKLNAVPTQIQSENFEIVEVSSLIAENFKSEKLEDKLEEIVPFDQTLISKAVEAESPNPNMQTPKKSLNEFFTLFPTHHELKKHQDKFHHGKMVKDGKTELSCDMPGCEYVTKDRRHLWRHKKTHSTERPWKCDQCDYTCKVKDSLIIHQEMVYSNRIVNLDKKYSITTKS